MDNDEKHKSNVLNVIIGSHEYSHKYSLQNNITLLGNIISMIDAAEIKLNDSWWQVSAP